MPTTKVTLDFYDDVFYIKAVDFTHNWATRGNFLNTGFPYSESVALLTYEPMRNNYSVEYIGGQTVSGRVEEIVWIEQNLDQLIAHAKEEKQALANVVPTIRQMRKQKLDETDWMVQRHQEELLSGNPVTLDEEQFQVLLGWRQWMREIPDNYPGIDLDGASTALIWAELRLSDED